MKNNDNYDIRYYYIKNSKPKCPGMHRIACVCMLRNRATGTISRGISFCSVKEKYFNKVAARGIAYQRALAADVNKISSGGFSPTESTRYAVDTMRDKYGLDYADGVVIKSDFDITPTEFEVGVWDDDKQ